MKDFKIKRGLSSTMFISTGVINPKMVIEEGCWYLCTDTACLYLGVKTEQNEYTLKRINRAELADPDINVQDALEALNAKLAELETAQLFKKIQDESELPTSFDAETFDPNVTYYIPIAQGRINTYIFDKESESYYCTSNIDDLIIRTMVTEAIEEVLNDQLDLLVPAAVERVISTTILHGGDANPLDD